MNDTIVAIATAPAKAPIAVIRVSGNDAFSIVNQVFDGKDLNKTKTQTMHYGHIIDNGVIIDEVLVAVFHKPKTFTGENVVEINCHGGLYVTNRILTCLVDKGARYAEPGEFTKRAFLNGRIDLTQAEAVMDIIEAQTEKSMQMANYGLLGETKKIISSFTNQLLQIIAQIEVNIDYPEYETEKEISEATILPNLKQLIIDIDDIIKKANVSQLIKYGIKTAIIGKPNVGKSSLLNALLREDKAIVTEVAGTTRDVVEGDINIGGIILHLMDTAGIRPTNDVVEKIGVEKTKTTIKNADLIILVFDYSEELEAIDQDLLSLTKNKKRIIVINKNDLTKRINLSEIDQYVLLSSFNTKDIYRLEQAIKQACHVEDEKLIDPSYIGNTRHISQLKQAKQFIADAITSLEHGFPLDIANIDIRNAWVATSEILGQVSKDDIINKLFSSFCLGK